MQKNLWPIFLLACLSLRPALLVAQDACATNPPAPPSAALPGDDGCICERSALLGDWCGTRTEMLQHGMLWNVDHTNYYFGVASGGREQQFTYAGHGDYVLNWDLNKVGFQQGFFLKLRAEHRYGQSISGSDGSLIPSTIQADLPVSDSEEIYLTNVLFTQMLSENFAVFGGKIDTLDGDANVFAGKRGKDQFSNLNFVANPLLLRAVPYSTLATGFSILDEQKPIFTFTVINPTDTTQTDGFSELFADGVTLTAEARRPHEWGNMPGAVTVGGAWSSREYVSLGQDPRILLPNTPIARQDGTWAVYSNVEQYLTTYDNAPGKGWGVFGRASIADEQANPLGYFVSAGLGGNNYWRQQDTWGVGYYYLATSDDIGVILTALLGPIGDGQGVELFYNREVTPWFHLTADLQVLDPEVETFDTALLVGLRGKINF